MNGNHVKFLILSFRSRQRKFPELLQQRFNWKLAGTGQEMTATDVLMRLGYDRPTKTQATDCSRLLQKMTGGPLRRTASKRLFRMPPMLNQYNGEPY